MEGGQQEQGRLKHTRASRILKICYSNEKLMKKQNISVQKQSFFAILGSCCRTLSIRAGEIVLKVDMGPTFTDRKKMKG